MNGLVGSPRLTRWAPQRLCDYVVNDSELPDRLVGLCVALTGLRLWGWGEPRAPLRGVAAPLGPGLHCAGPAGLGKTAAIFQVTPRPSTANVS